jgi:ribosomal protein S4E
MIDLTKDKKDGIKHLKFEKGAKIYLTDGKHVGTSGIIEDKAHSKTKQSHSRWTKEHSKHQKNTHW